MLPASGWPTIHQKHGSKKYSRDSTHGYPLDRVECLAQPCRNGQPKKNEQDSEKQTSFGPDRSAGQPSRAIETAAEEVPRQRVPAVGNAIEVRLGPVP